VDLGLARVSTIDQNPQLQLDALAKAGCDPVLKLKAGATTDEWLAFRDKAVAQLQPGDTLTTWRLDRLGRSFVDLYDTCTGLHQRGITYRSLTENIDLSSKVGELILVLLGWFAEFERAAIIERTLAGKANRAALGLHPGGARGYGFATDRTTVVEAEAAILREVATRVLDRETLAKVVDDLNARGVPTATEPRRQAAIELHERGISHKQIADELGGTPDGIAKLIASEPGRWNESTLRRTLLRADLVPAILPAKVHDDLARLFQAPDRQHQGRPAQHLLAGILRCQCGAAMYVVSQKERNGARHLAYRCRTVKGGRDGGCGQVSIRADRVEGWITAAVAEAVCSKRFADHLNARRAQVLAADPGDFDAMRAELADLEATPARYRDQVDPGGARAAELHRLIRQAKARLLASPELAELLDLPRTVEAFEAAWSGWDVAERRRRLRLLLDRVTVKATGKGRKPFDPGRLEPDWRF
jgi:DNA invertase Pin-like site-specific DNA recombinase